MSDDQKEPEIKGIGEDKEEGFFASFDYEKAVKFKKWSTVLAAVLLAIVAISKVAVTSADSSKPANSFIMTFYFCVIAIIMVAVEFGQGSAQQWFLFLNFAWGKVFMYVYLICAILGSSAALAIFEYLVCGLLLVACFFNLYVNHKYKHEEMNRIQEAIERIQLRTIRENNKREQNA